jgi:predicted amidophosphoribosyltransferase
VSDGTAPACKPRREPVGEFENRWRDFTSTKFDTELDCFKCSDERSRDEAMCSQCGKALDQASALFVSTTPAESVIAPGS